MTTTSVDDAIILPQSQGTGLSGEDSVIDAAINGVLNRYVGGEYVSSTYSTGLAFQNHNASNDTVEVGPGIVFVQDNSTSTSGERGSGGNPQAESSTTSGYDTELPEGHTYAVLLPTATQISVSDSTLNEVYVDIDDVTANNSVNLEHDGSSNASPGNTSLKIGETNPDDASADTRANDDANPTFNSLKAEDTNSKRVGEDYHYSAAYGGGDADTRLDNTLSSVNGGEVVNLENAPYLDNRTFAETLVIVGTSGVTFNGSDQEGNWTFNNRISLESINSDGEIVLNEIHSSVSNISQFSSQITVNADQCRLSEIDAGEATLSAGTSNCIVDSCINVTVTDNGSNTVGNIA